MELDNRTLYSGRQHHRSSERATLDDMIPDIPSRILQFFIGDDLSGLELAIEEALDAGDSG